MRRQQRIYDKLAKFSKAQEKPKTALSKCKYDFSKKKVRLKNHNVKLSLIDEINEEYEYVNEAVGIASYYGYERLEELEDKYLDLQTEISIEVDNMAVNSSVSYVEEGVEKLSELLLKVVKIADDLGVSPREIYPEYEEKYELATGGMAIYNEFVDRYKEFTRLVGLTEFL